MFKRILIANRGEIAQRIIRACREMGIDYVGMHTETPYDSALLAYLDKRERLG